MWPFKKPEPVEPVREIGTVQFIFEGPWQGRRWHRAYLDNGELVPEPKGCDWPNHEAHCGTNTLT
jgi:hypothetical protein